MKYGTAVLLALMALAAAGCGPGDGDEGPIRIGVLYPTTGVGQVSGAPALLGHQMMVDRINEEGGLLGREVVTIHRDTRTDPAQAAAMARELVSRHGVRFLLGGLSSSEGLAISEVARQEGVIYLATIPKTGELTDPEHFHPYVFRTAANTNTEARSAAILTARLEPDRVCTILYDYAYGRSLDGPFREHLRELHPSAQIVYQAWPRLGGTDYTAFITNILNAGCDVVFGGIWSSNFPTFAKQAHAFNFFDRVEYVSAGEVGPPEISEELGAEMPVGIWANSYEVFYYPETPEHLEYVRELRARIGQDNTPSFPIVGYIGMQFLAEAIRQAGTTRTDEVRDALRGLTIMTPIGEQTMRASDHQANRGQFWGQMNRSSDPGYPFLVMDPVEYIPADDIMD